MCKNLSLPAASKSYWTTYTWHLSSPYPNKQLFSLRILKILLLLVQKIVFFLVFFLKLFVDLIDWLIDRFMTTNWSNSNRPCLSWNQLVKTWSKEVFWPRTVTPCDRYPNYDDLHSFCLSFLAVLQAFLSFISMIFDFVAQRHVDSWINQPKRSITSVNF